MFNFAKKGKIFDMVGIEKAMTNTLIDLLTNTDTAQLKPRALYAALYDKLKSYGRGWETYLYAGKEPDIRTLKDDHAHATVNIENVEHKVRPLVGGIGEAPMAPKDDFPAPSGSVPPVQGHLFSMQRRSELNNNDQTPPTNLLLSQQ
jgi:hypothetical protein